MPLFFIVERVGIGLLPSCQFIFRKRLKKLGANYKPALHRTWLALLFYFGNRDEPSHWL